MEKLSKTDTVGKLIFEDGLTSGEVADKLGIPIGRVHSYKSYYKNKHNIVVEKKLTKYEVVGMLYIEDGLSAEEISKKMGLKIETIHRYIAKYREEKDIIRLNEPEIWFKNFSLKWDGVRFAINPNAKRGN